MSNPVTDEEKLRASLTLSCAGMTDNLVSTACPGCDTRFAMLARYDAGGWHLRCTVCAYYCDGELK